jgi:hypothetical protein
MLLMETLVYLDILPSFYINFQSRSSDPRHSYLQDVSPFVTEDAVAFHGTMVVAQICQESLRYRSHAVGYRSRFLLQKTLESLRVALGNGKESLGAAAWGIQALISYYVGGRVAAFPQSSSFGSLLSR